MLKDKSNAMALGQMDTVFRRGVQVSWGECVSFLQWQLVAETSAAQVSVQVAPHVVDTAMK